MILLESRASIPVLSGGILAPCGHLHWKSVFARDCRRNRTVKVWVFPSYPRNNEFLLNACKQVKQSVSPVTIVACRSEDICFVSAFKMAETNIVVSKGVEFPVWITNYPR